MTRSKRAPRGGGKYEPLRDFLAARQHLPRVRMEFGEVADVIKSPLPNSASNHREWWANQSDTSNRPHAAAWHEAGFRVESVDQVQGWVEFARLS